MDLSAKNNLSDQQQKALFFLDPTAVREYANKLRNTQDPENVELAALLDETPDSVFSLSEKQKKLENIIIELQKHGASAELQKEFLNAIMQIVYNRAIQQLSDSMTGDIKAYWEDVMQTNPNFFQILALLNFYTKVAFEQELDDYIDGIIGDVADEYVQLLQQERNLNTNLMSLSKEKMDKVISLLEQGNVNEALVLMHQSNSSAPL